MSKVKSSLSSSLKSKGTLSVATFTYLLPVSTSNRAVLNSVSSLSPFSSAFILTFEASTSEVKNTSILRFSPVTTAISLLSTIIPLISTTASVVISAALITALSAKNTAAIATKETKSFFVFILCFFDLIA